MTKQKGTTSKSLWVILAWATVALSIIIVLTAIIYPRAGKAQRYQLLAEQSLDLGQRTVTVGLEITQILRQPTTADLETKDLLKLPKLLRQASDLYQEIEVIRSQEKELDVEQLAALLDQLEQLIVQAESILGLTPPYCLNH